MKKDAEQEKFDNTMDKLLAVPYSELKKKLDEEKEGKKKRVKPSSSDRASSGRV